MDDERRYDEREVGLILKRVAELHEREGDHDDKRAMTRGEIEEVVTELGISKALVARAATELSVQDVRSRPVWWLGGKTDLMFEEVVDGPIDEATFTRMLEVLRRSLGDPGEVERDGGTRVWSTTKATTRRVHFTVVEHPEGTTLRLEERMPSDARTTVGIATFASGFTSFMAIVPLKVVLLKAMLLLVMGPLTLTGAVLGWLAGRAVWKRRSRGREDALRRAFGEILTLGRRARARALPEG